MLNPDSNPSPIGPPPPVHNYNPPKAPQVD